MAATEKAFWLRNDGRAPIPPLLGGATTSATSVRPACGGKCFRQRWARLTVPVLSLLVLVGCAHTHTAKVGSFDFVQMCDPQLGFTDYAADLQRFEQAVKQINLLQPDLVVICGDLVNAATEKSFANFNNAKARLRVPSLVAPGNHDLGNSPTPKALEQYRRLVGKDYYSVEHKGCLFVVANSQLWKAPLAGETEKQDAWLQATLERAARKHMRSFVVMHYPPFVDEAGEPDNYFNLPLLKRKELLALLERCGVVAVLAGHTHKTITRDYHGIQMVTSESTSRNFDQRPYGFRVWHVTPQRPYRNEFVPLSSTMAGQGLPAATAKTR